MNEFVVNLEQFAYMLWALQLDIFYPRGKKYIDKILQNSPIYKLGRHCWLRTRGFDEHIYSYPSHTESMFVSLAVC